MIINILSFLYIDVIESHKNKVGSQGASESESECKRGNNWLDIFMYIYHLHLVASYNE